ncbi:hypothetical protein [Chamaesiphon sp. OTE_8_metabat_110]|uniref:hypothetical protein n=1 Tax=Chamaesiphon sp. OTE_8_metabat_110 TaxID=2964696 RepID=UPI00286AE3DE|nr:hypothetical protein [Chamaesiphon sp. OTE_8_metabat_110]
MKIKEQLLQELNSTPDRLLVETLNFLQFIKAKEELTFSTGASLLVHLKTIGTWQGNDFDECLQDISDTRLPAEFTLETNPFD